MLIFDICAFILVIALHNFSWLWFNLYVPWVADITSIHPWRTLSVLKSNSARALWSSSLCNSHSFCPTLISSFFWTFDVINVLPTESVFCFWVSFCFVWFVFEAGSHCVAQLNLQLLHSPAASQGLELVSYKHVLPYTAFPPVFYPCVLVSCVYF